jgi:hypothetical protein
MKKRHFVPWTFMLILFAFPASVAFAAPASNSATIPGTVCLTHSILTSNDPYLTVSTWTDTVIFDSEATGRFRVTSQKSNWPVAGANAFCEGFAQVVGSELVSTLTCSIDGSQIPFTSETPGGYPFWVSSVYHCTLAYKNGKVMLPGYFWATYEYELPGLFSTTSIPNGSLGPFAYYGEYTALPKCSTVTSPE